MCQIFRAEEGSLLLKAEVGGDDCAVSHLSSAFESIILWWENMGNTIKTVSQVLGCDKHFLFFQRLDLVTSDSGWYGAHFPMGRLCVMCSMSYSVKKLI